MSRNCIIFLWLKWIFFKKSYKRTGIFGFKTVLSSIVSPVMVLQIMQKNTLGKRTQKTIYSSNSEKSEKVLKHRIRSVAVARSFTHQLDVVIDQRWRHLGHSLLICSICQKIVNVCELCWEKIYIILVYIFMKMHLVFC